jgi:hypothetical protein
MGTTTPHTNRIACEYQNTVLKQCIAVLYMAQPATRL